MRATPDESTPRSRLAGLFEEHREGLAGAVRGILGPGAEVAELLQESFLRAWRAVGRTRPADPVAWIFVVTLNTARDERRRRLRRRPHAGLEEIDPMTLETHDRGPDGKLQVREAVEAARAAIHRLRDKEKEVFLLRTSGGLTFEAIAAALTIPVGTAKTRMRRALAQLREHLAGHAPATEGRRTSS